MRSAEIIRETGETAIRVHVDLDGEGKADVQTGVPFFDHMLAQIARHGFLDLTIRADGDTEIDAHHTVEDVGICLGQAILKAVGQPEGIARYGHAVLPMDEALAEAAVDFSGRPYLVFRADIPKTKVGEFDAELAEEFFRAFAMNARITLHIVLRYGNNVHHAIEIIFKTVARALAAALAHDPRVQGVPSTKGMLEV